MVAYCSNTVFQKIHSSSSKHRKAGKLPLLLQYMSRYTVNSLHQGGLSFSFFTLAAFASKLLYHIQGQATVGVVINGEKVEKCKRITLDRHVQTLLTGLAELWIFPPKTSQLAHPGNRETKSQTFRLSRLFSPTTI